MKMKKKLIKKQNILNRNIYINYYSSFIIYNYLNNYNLKFFFYFLKKKKYYFNNKIKFKLNIQKLQKFNSLTNKVLINFKKSDYYLNKSKDKFFNQIKLQYNLFFNNNKFTFINKSVDLNNNNNTNILYNINNCKILVLNNIKYKNNLLNYYFNRNFIYKELLIVSYLLTLLKLLEIYKILINLHYFIKN